ncbi:hypothetical protein L9F63_023594, partial [Diploptera punctata]
KTDSLTHYNTLNYIKNGTSRLFAHTPILDSQYFIGGALLAHAGILPAKQAVAWMSWSSEFDLTDKLMNLKRVVAIWLLYRRIKHRRKQK